VGLIHADLTSPFFFSVISLSGVVIVDHDSCRTTGAADIFAAHPLLRSQNQNRALRKGWATRQIVHISGLDMKMKRHARLPKGIKSKPMSSGHCELQDG